jgi:plastocyanin
MLAGQSCAMRRKLCSQDKFRGDHAKRERDEATSAIPLCCYYASACRSRLGAGGHSFAALWRTAAHRNQNRHHGIQIRSGKIWVAAGRKVTLVLDNRGAETEHGIIIPASGFHLATMAGEVARKTAVFDKPGEYEFSCDLTGHRELGIVGRF